jgi:hypothetical protein
MKTDAQKIRDDIFYLACLMLVMWVSSLMALVKVASMLRQLGAN